MKKYRKGSLRRFAARVVAFFDVHRLVVWLNALAVSLLAEEFLLNWMFGRTIGQCGIRLYVSMVPFLTVVVQVMSSNAIRSIREENLQLSNLKEHVEELFGIWLLQLVDRMGPAYNWRASFYVIDDNTGPDDAFRLAARESRDSLLVATEGRPSFKSSEGVIGEAWQKGFSYYYVPKRALGSRSAYATEMSSRWKMSMKDAMGLTMMSQCILGRVVKDSDGNKRGVVILETKDEVKKAKRAGSQLAFDQAVGDVEHYLVRMCDDVSGSIFGLETA